MTAPIVKTVIVPLPPDRAFRLFTEEMSDWWPLGHGSRGSPEKTVTVTPEPGGPVFETRPGGGRAEWGRVTEWKPGRAFGMTWHPGHPEAGDSHVRVSFDAVADGTRVTLVHAGWHSLGNRPAAIRTAQATAWDGALCARYAHCAGALTCAA